MTRKTPIFFGWYLVGIMIIALTLVYGTRSAFSSFFPYLLDTFHWERGATAIMMSLNLLVYGITAPFVGTLVDKWKPRAVAVIGILVLAVSTAACHYATELWQFYLLYGIGVPLGTSLGGSAVFNAMIMNWFQKRRGLALGLGQIGGGLSLAYIMIIDWVNINWGWQYSFFVIAGLIIVVLAPLYLVVFRYKPSDKGMKPWGAEEVSPLSGRIPRFTEAKPAEPDWTLRRAFKTYQLWLLVLSNFCFWGLGNYLVIAHQIKFVEDAGFTSTQASSIFALFGIVSIGGQMATFISDSIGREKAVLIAIGASLIGMGALISVHNTADMWLLYVYAIGAGFATGLFTPTVIVSFADLFHGKNIGAISALALTGIGVGGAFGPWLGGFIYDLTGSYTGAFIMSMAAIAFSGMTVWIAAPRNAKKLREKMLKEYQS
jgi:MFS family permease